MQAKARVGETLTTRQATPRAAACSCGRVLNDRSSSGEIAMYSGMRLCAWVEKHITKLV